MVDSRLFSKPFHSEGTRQYHWLESVVFLLLSLAEARSQRWERCWIKRALAKSAGPVKVPHRSEFDAQVAKRQLGIAISSWNDFMMRMKALSECRVNGRTTKASSSMYLGTR